MNFSNSSRSVTGILDKVINGIGGVADDAFLLLPKLIKPFAPRREIDRRTYERQVDFYFDQGYVEAPETFFQITGDLPEYAVASEADYFEGVCREIVFSSPYIPRNVLITDQFLSFTENKDARMVLWTHGDPGRKTLVCLHGYMLGDPDQAEKMFKVKKLFQMGLDVVLFITPFHWKRAPSEKIRRGIFLQPDDVVMTCECFGQAMHDLSLSLNVLKDMEAGDIGLIGASLGGYNAALFSCLTDRVAFAALMVPAVKFSGDFGPETANLPFYVDEAFMDRLSRLWTLHSPLNFYPRISRDRILVVASRGDKVCPFVHVRDLCEKWGWPNHVFMTGGHWLVANAGERGRAWYRFLAKRGFVAAG